MWPPAIRFGRSKAISELDTQIANDPMATGPELKARADGSGIRLTWGMALKVAALLVAISGLFWRVGALETTTTDMKNTGEARYERVQEIARQQGIISAQLSGIATRLGRIEDRLDALNVGAVTPRARARRDR